MPLGASRLNFLAKTQVAAAKTFRSDSYSSSLVLAAPYDYDTEFADVHADIKGSGSNITPTVGNNASITTTQVKWTSSPDYQKGYEGIATSGQSQTQYALGTSIPSSASGTFVIEGWFYANSATTNANWCISSADSGGRFLFGINSGTTFTFGGENNIGIGSGWHHLAIVCDSGTKRFYYDGIYKGAWYSTNTGFSTLHIGQFNAGDTNDFRGHIQDLRVYVGTNKGYTGTNSSSANFTLPSSIVETYGPPVAETTSDSSIEFRAGDYGYIDALTASSTSNPYSVFMWFYIDSGYGVSNYQFLTESFRNGIHAMRIQIESSKLTCDIRDSSNSLILRGQSTSTISADTWYAVWLSYDPSTTTNRGFYYQQYGSGTVNSISFSTNTTGTYQSGYYDATKDIGIAARGANGAVATRGNIAEFWIDDTMRDFTSSANRQKFVDSSGYPVDLGSDGSTPFSAQPPIYIAGSNMLTTNRGDDGTTPTYSGSPPLGSAVGTI